MIQYLLFYLSREFVLHVESRSLRGIGQQIDKITPHHQNSGSSIVKALGLERATDDPHEKRKQTKWAAVTTLTDDVPGRVTPGAGPRALFCPKWHILDI